MGRSRTEYKYQYGVRAERHAMACRFFAFSINRDRRAQNCIGSGPQTASSSTPFSRPEPLLTHQLESTFPPGMASRQTDIPAACGYKKSCLVYPKKRASTAGLLMRQGHDVLCMRFLDQLKQANKAIQGKESLRSLGILDTAPLNQPNQLEG
ncbi:hypothetical protein CISG_08404 [Coccidioides immitis RMSCC 3703]|uniref:Uncharacterized protein n=1 Tax=Coccidioides immitis RMSCC 3703 TaxID=454286 RepID=A0A0J8R943_COCIT|nr:hypothetical protein CISG_08404 [Coccidioides immitis RMSCC 3703]